MKVLIEIYKWEGEFFPFKIKKKCGECSLSTNIIKSVINETSKKGISVELIEKPWLNNWYKVIHKGGWHAPIVLVNGKILSQGIVVSKEKLLDRVYEEAYKDYKIPQKGNYIFTQQGCGYCEKAKKLFHKHKIKYAEFNVIEDTANMKMFLALVLGKIHPITTPQIFIEGKWVGGSDDFEEYLKNKKGN